MPRQTGRPLAFTSPVNITVTEPKVVTLEQVTIQRVVDVPGERICRAFINELPGPLVLWEGADYDAAGQWTDDDIDARIKALLGAQ